MKISLCMIVKNEESVLSRCLQSVKDCVDEIVITDTGSTDGTVTVARGFTDRLYFFAWNDNFSDARNFAFSKATGDYLLWLDADDFISPQNAERLKALKKELELTKPDVVICPYDTAFDEAGNTLFTYYRERLLKRTANFLWQGRVHECIAPRGKILRSEFRVFHLGSEKERGARNLHIYQKWAAEEPLCGRDLFYYGRELYYNKLYTEAVAVLNEMLEKKGWYVNQIEACNILSQCHRARGETKLALSSLLRSFEYGEPRAGIVCNIAALFTAEKKFKEAAFWYESALVCRDHSEEGDFEQPAYRSITPLLGLTCCYYALGDIERTVAAHKKAEEQFPNHPSVVFNRTFFTEQGLLPPSV